MPAKKNKVSSTVSAALKGDVYSAVAVVSLLLNLFFITGAIIYGGTDQLDVAVYNDSRDRLCNTHYTQHLANEIASSADPDAGRVNFEIICKSGEFVPFYENAVEAYKADQGV